MEGHCSIPISESWRPNKFSAHFILRHKFQEKGAARSIRPTDFPSRGTQRRRVRSWNSESFKYHCRIKYDR